MSMSPSEKTKIINQVKSLEAAVARLQECNGRQRSRIKSLEQQVALCKREHKKEQEAPKKSKE